MKFRPDRNEACRCWTFEDGELENYLPLNDDLELVLGSGNDRVKIRLDRNNPPNLKPKLSDEQEDDPTYIHRAAATVITPRDTQKNPFIVLSRKANRSIAALIKATTIETLGTSAKILAVGKSQEKQEALVALPGIVKIVDDARTLYLTAIHKSPTAYEDPKLHTEEGYEKYRARLLKRGLDLEKYY